MKENNTTASLAGVVLIYFIIPLLVLLCISCAGSATSTADDTESIQEIVVESDDTEVTLIDSDILPITKVIYESPQAHIRIVVEYESGYQYSKIMSMYGRYITTLRNSIDQQHWQRGCYESDCFSTGVE